MATPRAPRKPTGGVDAQIMDLEEDIRNHLEYQLIVNVTHQYWQEMDQISQEDVRDIDWAIDGAFRDILLWYENFPTVREILERAQFLFKNTIWAGMNVPYPANPQLHVEQVIDNSFTVYNRLVYADLRTEMIMANHNVEILQRNWRRCIVDPSHPVCRRRLEYEFREMAT
jgi:hypothetical protein